MENQTTISKLFNELSIQFAIPSYQRAYSWEWDTDKEQVKQFLADIKEQNPDKRYFLGHFLFEKDINQNNRYLVIDGQQRLTTIVIFISCLIRELERREKEYGPIVDEDDEIVELWRMKEMYLQVKRNYKFETVSYDNPYFKSAVLEDNNNVVADSASSKRIKKAKKEFEKELSQKSISNATILQWKKVIDDAVITTFVLEGVDAKLQATQIFAFQNDRGKSLTTLEKLKAFLMHKIYSISESTHPESQIRDIEMVFSDIYRQTERISLSEDSVLSHHCIAFLSSWDSPIESIKKEISKIHENSKKENWIINFVNNLKETYINVEKIEKKSEQNCAIADILILDSYNSLPLLIKLFHFHTQNEELIEKITRKVELILFRLEFKQADYRTNNLHSIAKHYEGDSEKLSKDLSDCIAHGFQCWWNFNGNCINYFNSNYHYHKNIKYVLWKYENNLRGKKRIREISPNDYKNKFNSKSRENTIDHITPQNPNFRDYSIDFMNQWLDNIGNLTLLGWGNNSEKRDNNPTDKIELFDQELVSNKDIRDTLMALKEHGYFWDIEQIKERKNKIVKFVIENWELK